MNILVSALFLACISTTLFAQRTVGVLNHNASRAFKGYTLLAPITTTMTYLIDNDGQVVNVWKANNPTGQVAMLLDDGSLLRTAAPQSQWMQGGGAGGMIELYSWSGERLWQYTHLSPTARTHHDVEVLPNGNLLMLVWESHTREEAVAQGRLSNRLTENALWSERVIELKRTGATSGEIVWSWSSWDHMIQDVDPAKPNYGVVSEQPERIDINAGGTRSDWLHANSVRYNVARDEVMISIHNLNEIWIISRKTGDIVYRYGNPRNYKCGTQQNQVLFGQHDARWLSDSRVMIFNNGNGRFGGNGSSVDEIDLPLNEDGTYRRDAASAYVPQQPIVVYPSTISTRFYAQNISGATRLPNGNTLSCLGPSGVFVESTPEGDEVWRYVNPVGMNGIASQGQTPRNNMVFKTYRYGEDHPAVKGRKLAPRGRLEDGPLSVSDADDRAGITYELDVVNDRAVVVNDRARHVEITCYDVRGAFLGTVHSGFLESGRHVMDVPGATIVVTMRYP
jgi:hypothetical protein